MNDLLSLIKDVGPISIYGLAKKAERPYRRVHDHVHALYENNAVTLTYERTNNRQVTLVASNDPVTQRLIRVCDLYEAYQELAQGRGH